MGVNLDTSKITKTLKKAKISLGISEPDVWLDSGNYGLNFNLSGDFNRAYPNKRSVMFWGESGTGKTLLACLAAVEAQRNGYHVVYIDTENGLDTTYLNKIGMDTSDGAFTAVRLNTLKDCMTTMTEWFNEYDPTVKICFVIDSLTNMKTESANENVGKGKLSNDFGLFAKKVKELVSILTTKIGDRDNFLFMISHAYANQDILNGKGTHLPSGGGGMIFAPSISIFTSKLKLKDAETKKVVGIKLTAEVTKTRFTQLGGKIRLEVPYSSGLDPIDGLLDLACEADLVDNSVKGWYSFGDPETGEVVKFRKRDFGDHYRKLFDFDEKVEIVEADE